MRTLPAVTTTASPFRRRTFLATIAGGAVAATGVGRAAAAVPAGIRRSTFTPQVGSTFSLAGPSGTVRAVLEDVDDLTGATAGSDRAFALSFRCAPGTSVSDGTYSASCRGTSTTLFLGVVERGRNGPLLQAVVHQI
jgi:hypothetical protein